jgi:hypothetical protein
LYLFAIWEISWWNHLPCSSETPPMFQGEKIQWACREWSFNVMFHPMTKLAPTKFHCHFLLLLPRKFLQTFSNAFQGLMFVAFNYVLMPWSSNGCLICRPNQIPSFILISFIVGNVCLK